MAWDEKIIVILYALLGAFLAVLIFIFTLGGSDLLVGKSNAWWNGLPGLFLAGICGGAVGAVSYRLRYKEIDFPELDPHGGDAGAILFIKRGGVIIAAAIAIYFLWQLGKSV